MTEVNEVDFDKHMKMQFIEFIEALGRIAEKLNLDTLKTKVKIIIKFLMLIVWI